MAEIDDLDDAVERQRAHAHAYTLDGYAAGMIRGLDHVVLVVMDLDAAIADHRARGYLVQRGGEHPGGVSHNALIGFADGSYLELFAFHDLAKAGRDHTWAPVAKRGGGWADFALRCDDVDAEAKALGELVAGPATPGGRTRPDGVQLAWTVARLRKPLPFLITDRTARELRVPSGDATRHPNGVAGVTSIVLGATNRPSVADAYARLRDRGAPPIDIREAKEDGVLDVIFAAR